MTPITLSANGLSFSALTAGPADGPLLFLLHGFPEMGRAWREYLGPLGDAGYRVVAPDLRGYPGSSKPHGIAAYDLDRIADDLIALAESLGARRFSAVGHDWGASALWWLAGRNPERLAKAVMINAPHPAIWRHGMEHDPAQKKMSAYVKFFRLPWLPEALMRAGNFKGLAQIFDECRRPAAFPPEERAAYRAGWAVPGALTAMVNWYRALLAKPLPAPSAISVTVPLLLIWGAQDRFAHQDQAKASLERATRGQLLLLEKATHWVHHEEPQACLAAITAHLGPAAQL